MSGVFAVIMLSNGNELNHSAAYRWMKILLQNMIWILRMIENGWSLALISKPHKFFLISRTHAETNCLVSDSTGTVPEVRWSSLYSCFMLLNKSKHTWKIIIFMNTVRWWICSIDQPESKKRGPQIFAQVLKKFTWTR